MPSPIEMMVDAATGYNLRWQPAAPSPLIVSCPYCGRRQQTPPAAYDPPGTTEVETACPDCKDLGPVFMRFYDSRRGLLATFKEAQLAELYEQPAKAENTP